MALKAATENQEFVWLALRNRVQTADNLEEKSGREVSFVNYVRQKKLKITYSFSVLVQFLCGQL
jgi:hypothetical protein